jgi:BASS family bile acid:Na+ symporter
MFNKICDWITKFLVLWVILICCFGFLVPKALVVLRPCLDYFFMFAMLGIGFVMAPGDFKPLLKNPFVVLLGTLTQFGIMSFLGWFFAKALRLPPTLAIGLILAGSAPGAMASNVISYLARADVAYSIAITSTTTFLAPFITPALLLLYGRTYIKMEFWPMFFSIVQMVIVPLAIGFTIKHFMKERVEKIKPVFPAISTVFIAFICGLVVALNRDYLQHSSVIVFVAVALHNFFGLVFGYIAGTLYRFKEKMRRTLTLEVGMHNAGLGAVLALKYLGPQSALPNALFAVWCIITASILANIWAKNTTEPMDTALDLKEQ